MESWGQRQCSCGALVDGRYTSCPRCGASLASTAGDHSQPHSAPTSESTPMMPVEPLFKGEHAEDYKRITITFTVVLFLVILSHALPWYVWESTSEYSWFGDSGTLEERFEFGIHEVEYKYDSGEDDGKSSSDWDDADDETDVVKLYLGIQYVQDAVLVLALVSVSLLVLMGSTPGYRRTHARTIMRWVPLLLFILAILNPIVFAIGHPLAWNEEVDNETQGEIEGPWDGFIGSGSRDGQKSSYYPFVGWFIALAAGIMAFIGYRSYKNLREEEEFNIRHASLSQTSAYPSYGQTYESQQQQPPERQYYSSPPPTYREPSPQPPVQVKEPAHQAPSSTGHTQAGAYPTCQGCGGVPRHIEETQRYWCDRCQRYLD